MKIAIATSFDSPDFGSFLQAYCLGKFIQDSGHSVSYLKIWNDKCKRDFYYSASPKTVKDKFLKSSFTKRKEFGIKKYKTFIQAQKTFNMTDSAEGCDLLVLGGDEIWNINKPVFQSPLFWGDISIPAISYAAGIGNMNEEDFTFLSDYTYQLKTVKTFLVRDRKTSGFIDHYTGKNSEIVCDPSILVPVTSYGDECSDTFVCNNECLLVYAQSLTAKNISVIKKYSEKHGLHTVACCYQQDWCDYQYMCSPLEFSSLIRKCKAVVTTTYYGCLFSILNGAEFICIPENDDSSYLLSWFGLSNRLFNSDKLELSDMENCLQQAIDYNIVEPEIACWRKKSAELLENAIRSCGALPVSNDETICFNNMCTGCFACANICPVQAITSVVDEQGRTLPHINMDVCIKCGACRKICPQKNRLPLYVPRDCYAAQVTDKKLKTGTSSGGIASILAKIFISNGDAVCGAMITNGKVSHQVVLEENGLEKLKGSKYVQSELIQCYAEIKAQLAQDKRVLFIGTPCQVAAMRNTFKRYSKFYCVDIVCHGVPPQRYLDEHIEALSPNRVVDSFKFRGEPDDYVFKVISQGKVIYANDKNSDMYFYSFMKSLTCRENCYNCIYAQKNRGGDLTIGDFWKLKRKTLWKKYEGKISLLFVNTDKGEELFNQIKAGLICEKRPVEEAIKGNQQLRRPSLKHGKRSIFIRKYIEEGNFEQAIRATNIQKEMKKARMKKSFTKLVLPLIRVIMK